MVQQIGDTLYKQWEKMFTLFTDQLVRNQAFLGSMGKLIENSSAIRGTVERSMNKVLEQMQLPTRHDIADILTVLRKLETSVEEHRMERRSVQKQIRDLSQAVLAMGKAMEVQSRQLDALLEGTRSAPASKASRKAAPKKAASKKAATKKG